MSESKKSTRAPVPDMTVLRANSLRTWSPFLPAFDESLTNMFPVSLTRSHWPLTAQFSLDITPVSSFGLCGSSTADLSSKTTASMMSTEHSFLPRARVPGHEGLLLQSTGGKHRLREGNDDGHVARHLQTCPWHQGLGTGQKFDGLTPKRKKLQHWPLGPATFKNCESPRCADQCAPGPPPPPPGP